MVTLTNQSALELTAQDKYFVDLVKNRITSYGQIPYDVPTKLIIDIIKESARLFYKWSWKATEKKFYRLNVADILIFTGIDRSVYFQYTGYNVQLPGYVCVVKDCYETDKADMPSAQELIENIQLLNRTAPYGQSLAGINTSMYTLEAGCKMIEQQAMQSIIGTSVPFHYNQLSHVLQIGKTLTADLILDVETNVDIQLLYSDDLYIRHVMGRTKQELKRVLAGHVIELPGGVTLAADEICNNLEDIEKVEEILKAGSGIGDLILQR